MTEKKDYLTKKRENMLYRARKKLKNLTQDEITRIYKSVAKCGDREKEKALKTLTELEGREEALKPILDILILNAYEIPEKFLKKFDDYTDDLISFAKTKQKNITSINDQKDQKEQEESREDTEGKEKAITFHPVLSNGQRTGDYCKIEKNEATIPDSIFEAVKEKKKKLYSEVIELQKNIDEKNRIIQEMNTFLLECEKK